MFIKEFDYKYEFFCDNCRNGHDVESNNPEYEEIKFCPYCGRSSARKVKREGQYTEVD